MSKQSSRRLTMLLVTTIVALSCAAASAKAQQRLNMSAEIPFEFTVGNVNLPAGSYTVRAITESGDALVISNRDVSVARLSREIQDDRNGKARLVFHRYGNHYFLAEIWSGEQTGRAVQKSRRERSLESEMNRIAKADIAASYELVEVVAVLR